MSRRVQRNGKINRQVASNPTPRIARTREQTSEAYQDPVPKKRISGAKTRGKQTRRVPRRRQPSPISEESSSAGGSETGDEASDEESESEEDDEPPVVAPSRRQVKAKMGPKQKIRAVDEVSLPGSTASLFEEFHEYYGEDEDPRLSPEENRKKFEAKVFAESEDDDDEVYHGVDEISESDDGETEHFEEQYLAQSLSDAELLDQDLYLNQIDGFSAYGFGDESDASVRFPSSQDSDSGNEQPALSKRVHFNIEDHSSFLTLANSPTITRALLPSAMPDNAGKASDGTLQSRSDRLHTTALEDPDDSDLTDDCLPEQAHHSTPNVLQRQTVERADASPPSSPTSKKEFKKPAHRRGPPRGIFIDEGDKTSGILDPTGKVILMTNPHLLGEEFARRYGNSQTSSPDMGFEELLDETDQSDSPPDSQALNVANPMIPYPSNEPLSMVFGTPDISLNPFMVDTDQFNFNMADFAESDMPDGEIALEDVIRWDDDDSEDDNMTSPIFMPPSRELSDLSGANNEFAHLMNGNVTAFRRNADPSFAAFNNMPSFDFGLETPPLRRKRKTTQSPYTSSHYQGVTPVQRVRDPNQKHTPSASSSQRTSKRRKLTI